jgi:hypothetical protein
MFISKPNSAESIVNLVSNQLKKAIENTNEKLQGICADSEIELSTETESI